MLDDIIFDVVIEAHHEVMKGKSVCRTCHTRYETIRFHHHLMCADSFCCLDAVLVGLHSYQPNRKIDAANSPCITIQCYQENRKLTDIRRRIEFACGYTFLRDRYYGGTWTNYHRAHLYAFNTIGTGAGNGSKDGTILLDCVNCQRQVRRRLLTQFKSMIWINVAQIASNRYAPHLASCMGLSSARRAPSARNSGGTSGKPKCV